MGLKTTNYEVKKLGIILPEAYAIVKDLTVRGKRGFAIIAVQSSRENADKVVEGKMQAIEEVRVDFIVNRDTNDRASAYEKAKSYKEVEGFNPETGKIEKVVKYEPFYGWTDDII